MTRCFLHIGTHKTGTCALQAVFASGEAAVARRIAYPAAGRILDGQHNLAWELSEDERFDPSLGTLADLIPEIGADPRPSVVSSEDFEYAHAHPEALGAFAAALRAAGVETRVIVYLRERVSYAESLYAELTRHGRIVGFGSFLDQIVRDGAFVDHHGWIFRFDYAALLAPFAAAFGPEALTVRPYVSGHSPQALTVDFFDVIGLPFGAHEVPTTGTVNPRCTLDQAVARIEWWQRKLDPDVPRPAPVPTGMPFAVLDASDVARFAERFADDDVALASTYDMRLEPPAPRPTGRTEQRAILDDVARLWELG